MGHTFAIEHAPSKKRGTIGGFVQSGFPLGYVLASLVFAFISIFAGKAAMSSYGWRIAFMTGIIPVLLALYIRRMLPESPEFEKAKARGDVEKAPFFSLFKPPALWDFLQVFIFMTGLFLTDYSVYGFLPNILTLGGRGFDPTTYSLIYGFALFMAFLGYNFYGWLSDRTGRKSLTMWYCVFLVVFGIPVYYVLYNAAVAHNIALAVVGTVMAAMLKLAWGIVPAYLSERFPTRRRAVGVGFGYSAGALIGAGFSLYVWYAHNIPYIKSIEGKDMWLSPAVILTVGAIITFCSLLYSPETKGIESVGRGSRQRQEGRGGPRKSGGRRCRNGIKGGAQASWRNCLGRLPLGAAEIPVVAEKAGVLRPVFGAEGRLLVCNLPHQAQDHFTGFCIMCRLLLVVTEKGRFGLFVDERPSEEQK